MFKEIETPYGWQTTKGARQTGTAIRRKKPRHAQKQQLKRPVLQYSDPEKELADQKRGITKASETGGTVPRADWAWSMSKAAPQIASNKNNSMGLPFWEIQKYDMYQLRAKMDEYGIFDSMKKAKEAYKA